MGRTGPPHPPFGPEHDRHAPGAQTQRAVWFAGSEFMGCGPQPGIVGVILFDQLLKLDDGVLEIWPGVADAVFGCIRGDCDCQPQRGLNPSQGTTLAAIERCGKR